MGFFMNSKTFLAVIPLALLAMPLHADDISLTAPPLYVTAPQLNVEYKVKVGQNIAEGFPAVRGGGDTARILDARRIIIPRIDRPIVLDEGTGLEEILVNDESWLCTEEQIFITPETRTQICFQDNDGDGAFETQGLKLPNRFVPLPNDLNPLRYEREEGKERLFPTEGLKKMLILDRYRKGVISGRFISFMEMPRKATQTEKFEVSVDPDVGTFSLCGMQFELVDAQRKELTLRRTGGSFFCDFEDE